MSSDNIPAPSVATQVRQANSDVDGRCLVCGAESDWQCDEVVHREKDIKTYGRADLPVRGWQVVAVKALEFKQLEPQPEPPWLRAALEGANVPATKPMFLLCQLVSPPPIVYLAGGILGLSDDDCRNWRELAKQRLSCTLDPMRRDYRGIQDDHVREIVDQDLADIDACDAVLAYCPVASWGTGMEIRYAWQIDKPVHAIVPEGTAISPWLRYHAAGVHKTLDVAIDALLSGYPAARCASASSSDS